MIQIHTAMFTKYNHKILKLQNKLFEYLDYKIVCFAYSFHMIHPVLFYLIGHFTYPTLPTILSVMKSKEKIDLKCNK